MTTVIISINFSSNDYVRPRSGARKKLLLQRTNKDQGNKNFKKFEAGRGGLKGKNGLLHCRSLNELSSWGPG